VSAGQGLRTNTGTSLPNETSQTPYWQSSPALNTPEKAVKEMTKFNEKSNEIKYTVGAMLASRSDATVNHEGELAFKLDPLMDLYIRTASTLVGEPKYYESGKDADAKLLSSIRRVLETDPEFVLQLAVYCREKLHLRSVPLMLLAEFANSTAVGKVPRARKYVSRVVQRADELSELTAYQLARNLVYPRKSKLPMMLKNGIADAFGKFDEYQFAKYNRDGAVKLRDVLFMTHPKPANPERQALYDRIARDDLATPETWEVMRSTGKMTWHQVINEIFHRDGRALNYMAQLRNLRNCLEDRTVTQEDIALLCRMLSDKNAVLGSRQLPFRFLSAYREVEKVAVPDTPAVLDALEKAVEHSIGNIPVLKGTTLIASDVSGSMETPLSRNSTVMYYDIGIVLSMIAHEFCENSLTSIFGTEFKIYPVPRTSAGLLANTMKLRNLGSIVGCATNGYKIMQHLISTGITVDRIMIFTDCQLWNSYGDGKNFAKLFLQYQRKHPNVKLYCFDLSGYGNIMLPQDTRNVCLIGGWSDRVFEFVSAFEEDGKQATISKIKAIKP